jgi:hypothetical protein
MLAVYCPRCRRRMLLSLDDIDAIRSTSAGIEVQYRCLHDHTGVWTRRTRRPT